MISSLQHILCCCHKGSLIWARKGSRTNGSKSSTSSGISQITFKLYKYILWIILCYQISISLYLNPAEFCWGHINLCLFLFAVLNQKNTHLHCLLKDDEWSKGDDNELHLVLHIWCMVTVKCEMRIVVSVLLWVCCAFNFYPTLIFVQPSSNVKYKMT